MLFLAAAVALATSPVALPGMTVTEADYPKSALRAGRQGRVGYRVKVDAAGVPSDCEVTSSAGPDLDAQACALVTARQRFTPAHDASGVAVAGSYGGVVKWAITERLPLADHTGVVTLAIDPQGEIARCRIALDDSTADLAGAMCGSTFRPWIEGATGDDLRPYREVTLVTLVRGSGAVEPKRSPQEVLQSRVSADWTINPDGSVGDCLVVTNDYPHDTELPKPCDLLAEMLNVPYAEATSAAARKVGTGLYIFTRAREGGGSETNPLPPPPRP